MIRINGKLYEGSAIYHANSRGDVAATFTGGLSDEQILSVLNATEIAVVSPQETLAVYALIKWRGMEKRGDDLVITWQTYVIDEVESIRQDNEDLTQAILELAAIVGGNKNG